MLENAEANRHEAQIDALMSALITRHPGKFDTEQTTQIRRTVSQLAGFGEQLRRYPLTNADEPDPIFRPYRRKD